MSASPPSTTAIRARACNASRWPISTPCWPEGRSWRAPPARAEGTRDLPLQENRPVQLLLPAGGKPFLARQERARFRRQRGQHLARSKEHDRAAALLVHRRRARRHRRGPRALSVLALGALRPLLLLLQPARPPRPPSPAPRPHVRLHRGVLRLHEHLARGHARPRGATGVAPRRRRHARLHVHRSVLRSEEHT